MPVCLRCGKPLSLPEIFHVCFRDTELPSLLTLFQTWQWQKKRWYCSHCFEEIASKLAALRLQLEDEYQVNVGLAPARAQYFRDQLKRYYLPDDFTAEFLLRIDRLLELTEILRTLPHIRVRRILDTDEYAYHQTEATYHKKNKEVKYIPGELLLTNKRLYFVGEDGTNSHRVGYGNVSQVRQVDETTLLLQVDQGKGGGFYEVTDVELTTLIIHRVCRQWKGHMVSRKAQANMQDVPGHIKVEVMQRDQGRCRMCGYEDPYIEFDHIIPRSKGGLNTLDNIQLLCRGCNRKKGDKLLQ